MKLHPSLGSRLSKAEEELESLRKNNHELRRENCTLRAQLVRGTGRTLPMPAAQPSTPLRTTGSSSSNGTTPSYAQPTRASRLRNVTSTPSSTTKTPNKRGSPSSSPEPSASTSPGYILNDNWNPKVPVAGAIKVNGKDVFYKDGKIKVMEFGFLRSTHSHECRTLARITEYPRMKIFTSSNATPARERPAKQTQDQEHPGRKFQIMSQDKFDALLVSIRKFFEKNGEQIAIATRTRLSDNEWITNLSSPVYINQDRLCDILTEALALAKRCVWRWFRTHRRGYIDYLSDIDFGRNRINSVFRVMPYTVQYMEESFIELRNRVCHFSGGSMELHWIDHYVRTVHKFAVLLLDEQGARAARGLRDQLRTEAEKTLEEIVTFMMLTACTGDETPWCGHHSSTVRAAVDWLQRHDDLGHRGLEIAAREWAPHHRDGNYGRGVPEVEECAETTDGSPHAVGMLDTTSREQQTGNIRQWEVMKWPRGSSSVEAGCPDNVLKGMGNRGNREGVADVYTLV